MFAIKKKEIADKKKEKETETKEQDEIQFETVKNQGTMTKEEKLEKDAYTLYKDETFNAHLKVFWRKYIVSKTNNWPKDNDGALTAYLNATRPSMEKVVEQFHAEEKEDWARVDLFSQYFDERLIKGAKVVIESKLQYENHCENLEKIKKNEEETDKKIGFYVRKPCVKCNKLQTRKSEPRWTKRVRKNNPRKYESSPASIECPECPVIELDESGKPDKKYHELIVNPCNGCGRFWW